MGLPCKHLIQGYLNNGQSLRLNDFHQHWWICHDQQPHQQSIVENSTTSLKQKWKNLVEQFQSWPAYQQAAVLPQLTTIMNTPIQLQNPEVQKTRGCPVGALSHTQNSTTRNPSAFELIDQSNRRKCGICHQIGHNSRTCLNT